MITWTNTTATLGQLKPWALNPRLSTKAQAKRLLKSWEDLGQFQTIAVSPEWDVYDGHQRLSALLTVHGPEHRVDVRQSDRKLTDGEHRELIMMAHVGAVGSWDWEKLKTWDAPELHEWGMDADALKAWQTDAAALATMLEADKPAPVEDVEPQVDRAEELRVKWGVEPGQLWQLGDHRLICGDCTDRAVVERVMDGERAETLVSDPPYGIGYEYSSHDDRSNADNLRLIQSAWELGPSEKVWTCGMANLSRDLGWNPEAKVLCWHKGFAQAGNGLGGASTWEPVLVVSVKGGTLPNDYLSFSTDRIPGLRELHSCPKPISLFEHLILNLAGSIVYEPFSGSGTTLIACERLGRKCRAIEIDPGYVAVALERWATATGKTPERLNG